MVKLSKPGEMDAAGSESDKSADVSGGSDTETVSMFADEVKMDPLEAIELLGEMVDQPDEFGIGTNEAIRELRGRVEELEAENDDLRRDLAVLWEFVSVEGPNGERVVAVEDGKGVGPESLDLYDPTGEFE